MKVPGKRFVEPALSGGRKGCTLDRTDLAGFVLSHESPYRLLDLDGFAQCGMRFTARPEDTGLGDDG
jgi:hypothetical protein